MGRGNVTLMMINVRRLIILVATLAVALIAAAPATAQEACQDRFEEWECDEFRTLTEAIVAAIAGEIVPEADPFEMSFDFFKGTDGNSYAPFTVSLDPAKVDGSRMVMVAYVLGPPDPPAPAAETEEDDDDDSGLPPSAFNDGWFVDVSSDGDGPLRFSRAFAVPGGGYDVFIALRESLGEDPDDDKEAQTPIMLLHQRVEVPDLWNNALQTSSIILASDVDMIAAPLGDEEQINNPYTLGTTQIRPKLGAVYNKQEELFPIFLVYNPGIVEGGKPNVTVEYNFHQRSDAGDEYFNRTTPQEFNGQTLPAEWNATLGHQIIGGFAIPLAVFPTGDYRLEIKVLDNTNSTEVIQDVMFTVLES